jgi:hypothetical protein
MSGRTPPTHNVVIAVPFVGRGGDLKTRWWKVGSAWVDDVTKRVNFNIVTVPERTFYLMPVEEKIDE